MELSSVTADDEVDRGQLKDPGRKKGQKLLPEAGGTRQDPTQKIGWCVLVTFVCLCCFIAHGPPSLSLSAVTRALRSKSYTAERHGMGFNI